MLEIQRQSKFGSKLKNAIDSKGSKSAHLSVMEQDLDWGQESFNISERNMLIRSSFRMSFTQRTLNMYSTMFINQNNPLACYNAVLATNGLCDQVDLAVFFDIQSFNKVQEQLIFNSSSTYRDFDKQVSTMFFSYQIAKCMSAQTCSFRFPGQLNSSLRKQSLNLTPFPRLHHLIPSYHNESRTKLGNAELILEYLYNKSSRFMQSKSTNSQIISSFLQIRG